MKTKILLYGFLFMLFVGSVHADLKDGLVIYFSFDNIDGKKVINEANNKLNGTLEGEAKQVVGYVNKGVALNPDAAEATPGNDFVRVADAPEVNVDKQFTIAMWASGTNFGDYRTLLSKTDGGAYALTVEGGKPNSWVHVAGDYLQAAGKTDIEKNKWYHYALTFDGSDAVVYLDGKEDGKGTKKGDVTICGADFMIGAEPSGQNVDPAYPAWHGILDEFYFYNRALTKDEINQILKKTASVDYGDKLAQTWGNIKKS
jgi:hypothetical protein